MKTLTISTHAGFDNASVAIVAAIVAATAVVIFTAMVTSGNTRVAPGHAADIAPATSSGNAAFSTAAILPHLVTELPPVIVVAHRFTSAEKIRLAQLDRGERATPAMNYPRRKS